MNTRSLTVSVLSSSSVRSVPDLVAELAILHRDIACDLLVLRDIDIKEVDRNQLLSPKRTGNGLDSRPSSHIMAFTENRGRIVDFISKQIAIAAKHIETDPPIAALATYFPDITSRTMSPVSLCTVSGQLYQATPRQLAEHALVNTVCLALELVFRRQMKHAIVEMVAGTTLDQCDCAECESERSGPDGVDRIFETERGVKIALLVESLCNVANRIEAEISGHMEWRDIPWALAVELEPGYTYVINNEEPLREFLRQISERDRLKAHVGLNVDIAHYQVAGVTSAILSGIVHDFPNCIVHSHICDLPDMHTRDQPVGSWNPADRYSSTHSYLRLLSEIANQERNPQNVPFSGCVAIELEGCNRISWIHKSVRSLKQIIETVSL